MEAVMSTERLQYAHWSPFSCNSLLFAVLFWCIFTLLWEKTVKYLIYLICMQIIEMYINKENSIFMHLFLFVGEEHLADLMGLLLFYILYSHFPSLMLIFKLCVCFHSFISLTINV